MSRSVKARWRVKQDYRELKDELGLDHYEGRSWQGFHHHLVLVTAAFVFLRQEQSGLHRRAQKACRRPCRRKCVDLCKSRSAA